MTSATRASRPAHEQRSRKFFKQHYRTATGVHKNSPFVHVISGQVHLALHAVQCSACVDVWVRHQRLGRALSV